MASVHESLYFNPMMTNGVVHANVFGIKDWVSPYKISVLALLYEMTASKMTLPERRRLNKLILPLQQGPDLTLGQFLKTVKECCPQTAYAVKLSGSTPSRGPLSQKQAEYFLARQAYLLKNDENKALKPAALQEELNNMLKFNPDFAEAHYLNYLNSMRVQDIFLSAHSLLHYFDRLILSSTEGKSNGEEGYGRSLRYAALNLASLHCRFGHYQQADLALQEAIRIAQESNDHVCLQHCLSWLYTLEQMKGTDSTVLTEDSVKMAAHFCLPYLASLGIQSLVQQGATQGKTAHKLMDALKDTDILHWKQSLSELIEISLAQTTSIWRMYGKSTMALQQAQLLLNMSSLEPVNFGVHQNNTEAFAVALCHLAELHAEQGLYAAASEVFQHLKEQFPPHTQHAKLWMLCDLKIQFEKHMNERKYHLAEPLVNAVSALNKTEGLYRKAQVLKALSRSTEAYNILQRLQVHCEKTKCTDVIIRVMLSTAELHWESSGFSTALPILLQALTLARQHHLQSLVSESILHLAFTQLMLGVPDRALLVLHEAMEPVLAHGAVIDKGRAILLAARCQMAVAGFGPNGHGQPDLQLALLAADTLNEAAVYFSKLNCKERLRDVHYLQAQLHRYLGQTQESNKSAMLFRLLDQELQTPAPPVSMQL
ncbi:anaphase-promoting complex subunit 5 [Nematolebias whitei]|uniref:anaphase-promoting complex subunit 5 n=1 Tax=Nematolebias whitei TaxID=451745 RepID=UPI001896CC97|nr:anaphase-promoting complex subunit 5 [Nematolebias whitei]